MTSKLFVVVLFACCYLQGISGGPVSQLNSENVIWFPNPNKEGTLIPARLEPSPHRIEFNESFIHFYLYTKDNQNNGQELLIDDVERLQSSNYKRGAELKIMSHGFGGSERSGFPQNAKNLFLRSAIDDMNVITVDWELLAEQPYYFEAAANTKTVGQHAARLVEFLISQQVVTRDKIHIIGFSLGAHVSGILGSRLQELPGRVTGLDPARPLFDVIGDEDRIDPSDGVFVDIIHTAGLTLAFLDPIGHADFYPNGGATQPGCGVDITGSCAHGRAPAYFEESISNPFGFRGQLCETWAIYQNGACSNNQYAIMGIFTPALTRGKFYFHTNSERPYAQG